MKIDKDYPYKIGEEVIVNKDRPNEAFGTVFNNGKHEVIVKFKSGTTTPYDRKLVFPIKINTNE